MTGRRYSLAEISKITNISKITLSDRKMAITKSRSNRSRKSTKGNKRHMEAHICMNSKTHRLTLNQLIKNTLTRLKILSERHSENSDMITKLLNDVLS